LIRKPARQSTTAFLDGLRGAFDDGAFLVPCIHGALHWVLIGAWHAGRVGMVDSFFNGQGGTFADLSPGLGFFSLSAEEFDALDWQHYVTLVQPGMWRARYKAWLLARAALLRMNLRLAGGNGTTLSQAIRRGAHQYLDDADYSYGRLDMHLREGLQVSVSADDPGGDAVGVESIGQGTGEVLVVRRLGGLVEGRSAVPELVLRARAVRVGQLAG
jgi:hypothetical protein